MKRMIVLMGIFIIIVMLIACTAKDVHVSKPTIPEAVAQERADIAKETWQVEWEKTLSKARKEGKVVVYGASKLDGRRVIIQAMKNLGITAEVITLQYYDIPRRVSSERSAGLFITDVFIEGIGTALLELKPHGYLDKIDAMPFIPEVVEPSLWYGGKGIRYLDSNRTVIVFGLQVMRPVTINTQVVGEGVITSLYDLLKPEWKGKILMGDPTIGSAAQIFGVVGAKVLNWDYWKEFVKQEPVLIRDLRLMTEWLSYGKYPIALGIAGQYDIFRGAGASIYQIPLEKGESLSAGAGGLALFANAPHPNAAKVFINWLLSKEGQNLYAKATVSGTARLDVSVDHLDETKRINPNKRYFDTTDEEWQFSRTEHIQKAKEIFGSLLK